MILVKLVKLVNLVIHVSGDSGNLTYLMNLVILATPTKSQQDKTKKRERYTPINLVILVTGDTDISGESCESSKTGDSGESD